MLIAARPRMNLTPRFLVSITVALPVFFGTGSAEAASEARVTHIVREVNLLPEAAKARPAAMNDRVDEDTGVRTGEKSRSELTFPDLTITRLGSNSVFSFDRAGRTVDLSGGSILLRVPKDSGGATIRAQAVSVAVTGTTLILETGGGGRSKLIVLEGRSQMALRRNAGQRKNVLAGQMLEVPAGATTLPEPVNVDINSVMKSHPLITGFPPLPSRGQIAQAAADQRNRSVPTYAGPGISVGGIPLGGLFGGGGGTPGGGRTPGGGTGGTRPPRGGGTAPQPGGVDTVPNPGGGTGIVGSPGGTIGKQPGGGLSGISLPGRSALGGRATTRATAKPTPPPIR